MTNKHQVILKTLTPITYMVEVETESEEEAYNKVKQDIDEKGWDSQYWSTGWTALSRNISTTPAPT
jgi:hypothetical protein